MGCNCYENISIQRCGSQQSRACSPCWQLYACCFCCSALNDVLCVCVCIFVFCCVPFPYHVSIGSVCFTFHFLFGWLSQLRLHQPCWQQSLHASYRRGTQGKHYWCKQEFLVKCVHCFVRRPKTSTELTSFNKGDHSCRSPTPRTLGARVWIGMDLSNIPTYLWVIVILREWMISVVRIVNCFCRKLQ